MLAKIISILETKIRKWNFKETNYQIWLFSGSKSA